MKRTKRLAAGIAVAGAVAFGSFAAPAAFAHNAANITVNGRCIDLGNGGKDNGRPIEGAPLVPESNPNRNADTGELDLIPGPGDQYGARFAAVQGNTPIEGGECR